MHLARVLLPVLVLHSLRCASEPEPSGFTGTSATEVTPPHSSFTSDTATTTSSTSSGPTTTDPTTTTTTTTGPELTTTDPTTTTTTTGPELTTTTGGICGDGVLDPGEQCDDGDGPACLDDCTPGQAILLLAGQGPDPALAARYLPGPGWSTDPLDGPLGEVALVATPDGALAVGRAPDDELTFTTWSQGQPDDWTALTAVGAFGLAIDGPGLAVTGDRVTLAFLGTDFKHYSAHHSGGAWSPFAPIPAGMPPDQAFGPSAAVLAGGLENLYAAYAGDDKKIYYNLRPAPRDPWQPSLQAPPPVVVSALTPCAIVDPTGDLLLAYVRDLDGKIAVVKLLTPQNAWTLETIVHDLAVAGTELAFLRTDAGAYYLAWKGYDTDGIYVARGQAHDDWGLPFTVDAPPTATLPPALAHGALGADAELLYVTGGALHHVRLLGEDISPPALVPGATGLTARPAAVRVQLAP